MLFQPQINYIGGDEYIWSLEVLKNKYEPVATNLKKARERLDPKLPVSLPTLKTEDTLLIKNHTTGPFDLVYVGNYCIVSIKGNQVEVIPATQGKTHVIHISNVKYVLPADNVNSKLPDYSKFGHKSKQNSNAD